MQKVPAFLNIQLQEKYRRVLATWEGTPYRYGVMVKGRGADCATFLAGTYIDLGIVEKFPVPYTSKDWHIHGDNLFLERLKWFREKVHPPYKITAAPSQKTIVFGDWLAFRLCPKRYTNHSAIALGQDEIIHCVEGRGVVVEPISKIRKNLGLVYRLYREKE